MFDITQLNPILHTGYGWLTQSNPDHTAQNKRNSTTHSHFEANPVADPGFSWVEGRQVVKWMC